MREVIEAIDGPICLNVCLNDGKDCKRKSWCPAHPVWARAQRAMVDVLMSVTVSAMAESADARGCNSLPLEKSIAGPA
jgi:DNA-binding IscR family transcriptional regulator